MGEQLYVATDRTGVQHAGAGDVVWDLAQGGTAPLHATRIELYDLDGLLDRLDERIFRAVAEGEVHPGPVPGVHLASAAHLDGELSWSPSAAARFALDCCAHAFAAERDLALPRGRSLGDVLTEAGDALEHAEADNAGMFATVARLSRLRHLRRTREALESATLGVAREDERDALDLLDDPAWTTLAAVGEAVLATLEALRRALAPRFVRAWDAEEGRLAAERRAGAPLPTRIIELPTPWGNLAVGGERIPESPPAARCAAEAAERVRQAVADRDGGAEAERAWQRARLAATLGG